MALFNFSQQRKRGFEKELRKGGIRDKVVLRAMRTVPREEFVSEELRKYAYQNTPLPIGCGQTISQPVMVAAMIEALELSPRDRVLEIGTGSGYQAAVLAQIAKDVFTLERHRALAEEAQNRLQRLGFENVWVLHADGTRGLPNEAPFDAIIVAAGSPGVPPALLEQLDRGGRLVIPVGDNQTSQQLVLITRKAEKDFEYEQLSAVRFVPLIGEAGWQEEEEVDQSFLPLWL